MKRDLFLVSAVFILVCIGLIAGATLAIADDVELRGTVGPRTIDDNVVIPRNATTTLHGTIIKGNVRVLRGAKLLTNHATILGNVQAYGSLLVDLRERTFVDADVQGLRTRSVLVRGGTEVGGNVQITEAAAPVDVDALFLAFAQVQGDVQAEKSAGRLRVKESRIAGNLQFVENYTGLYAITNNRISANLQFFKNRGKGTITGNYVGQNLQSKENSPRPTIRGNVVEGDVEIE